ncbi:MAG: WYL domain-containing protein [Methylococcaceae bacterium]|nr:WYL domain-containing protein [Methylococcaceae bacterium]
MQYIDKIFKLHHLLHNHRLPVSGKTIEEELQCSRATRERIIRDMRDFLGAPITYDNSRRGYHYDQHDAFYPYELPGLWFNAGELQALLACQHLLAELTPGILKDEINQLKVRLDKLLTQAPGTSKPALNKVKILHQGQRHYDNAYFMCIAAALFDNKRLKIEYHARSDDKTTLRQVSPQTLVRYRDNWYLDAWCHARNELRSFSIDRIQQVILVDSPVELIEPEQLQNHFAESYGIFSGEPEHVAILNFSSIRARWVADEQWHPKQKSQWLEDGRFQLQIPFKHDQELLMDILKYGADVEVVAPASLVAAIKSKVWKMMELYGCSEDR